MTLERAWLLRAAAASCSSFLSPPSSCCTWLHIPPTLYSFKQPLNMLNSELNLLQPMPYLSPDTPLEPTPSSVLLTCCAGAALQACAVHQQAPTLV
jgi:hypothetical protein